MIKRGGLCCIGRVEVDAVRFYEVEIEKIALKIKDVKGGRDNCNSGMGIVTFVSRLQVSRSIDYHDYRNLCVEKLHEFKGEERRWGLLTWEIQKAPSQSEILWDNLNKGGIKSAVKSFFLLILLMVVCIILVTPLVLV